MTLTREEAALAAKAPYTHKKGWGVVRRGRILL